MLKLSFKNVQVAIAGKVLLAETGESLAGARVEMIEMPSKLQRILQLKAMQVGKKWDTLPERIDRQFTRGDGSFFFTDLPLGDYVLQASVPDGGDRYQAVTRAFQVKQQQQQTGINFATATGNFEILPTGLKGQILGNGQAIAYAKIRAVEDNAETLSDVDGKFRFVGLSASTQPSVFQISRTDHPSQRRSVMLQRGVMTTIDFVLD
ncbi:collagen binding domain-containing protein [[Limnothrix rosea] IAM M-220]|uniref:MSCRAMM family protein n=1 Tax=[Limnothrix rosea] IAM M-220 TaxID=454133 RepID=UPI00095EE412|nr:carboxypeptidase-like regulatory domain-containing protein [[Limnothrix rosea] IAM M-220]OKH18104.1 hypothetical protein NIES208_07110 [[Limnothrix rosea] IAM M-220]